MRRRAYTRFTRMSCIKPNSNDARIDRRPKPRAGSGALTSRHAGRRGGAAVDSRPPARDSARVDLELLIRPPSPRDHESHEDYLRRLGLVDRGFAYIEVVHRGSPSHVLPPPRLWPRQIPPLVLAHELRARMRACGARGLRMPAAYRPTGGERGSLHKLAAAVDLDLLGSDLERVPRLAHLYAEVAAGLWSELHAHTVGIGTYAPEGHLWTRRVHLDVGYRRRCWQGTGRDADGCRTWSDRPAALVLAGHSTIAGADGPEDDNALVPLPA